MTANKQFSLADQSKNVLPKLDSPAAGDGVRAGARVPRYQDKMKEYEYASKKIATEYIDPDKKPTVAKQNQIQQHGTIVFNYKGRTERVTSDSEQDITTGIIKVVTGQQKKIYFTQGHGEKDNRSAERDGYNAIAAALGRENYTVDKVVIAQQGAVPEDAAVVIVAGPRTDFFPPEIEALKTYLGKSGKLLLELDPPDKPDSAPLTNLIALAHDWGMDVGNDVVVDVSGMGRLIGTDASVPVAANYPSHAITQRFSFITAYPLARSVTPGQRRRQWAHGADASSRPAREAGRKRTSRGWCPAARSRSTSRRATRRAPSSIAAAVSRPSTAPDAKAADANAPKPETRVVGHRRFRFRRELGTRHPGQPRPLHEHRRLAVAAGEPDFDPAEGGRRSAHHAHRDAAEQHHLAVAADHPGVHLRHRRLHAGGGGARCAA